MHEIKSRYQLAIIRELWSKRDQIASEIDLAPGRLLSDYVIIALAKAQIKTKAEFLKIPEVKARVRNEIQKSYVDTWLETYLSASHLKEADWPQLRGKSDSLPPVKIWKVKFPLAHAHLSHAKHNLAAIAEDLAMPLENLMTPELVRKICFDEGKERVLELTPKLITATETQLRLNGAREWQIEKCANVLSAALTQSEPLPTASEEEQPVSPDSSQNPTVS
jgi:ribonuclease D